MDLTKYKWKCRILLLCTTCYRDNNYKKSKELYQKHIKEFHKRHVKLMSFRKEYSTLEPNIIFDLIDSMPMSKQDHQGKLKPLNLSLYSDYKPETTLKGLGFKNKEKALYTVEAIKNRDLKYQVNVIATMLGRAKKHPYKTKNMKDAIKVFSLWMKNYKKNRTTKF